MLNETAHRKAEALHELLRSYKKAVIAFSGGVDSTFLLASAQAVLGANIIAVTADSAFFPSQDRAESLQFCKENQIRQIIFQADILHEREICQNPPNRCYLCKRLIFRKIQEIADAEGITVIAEGSNADDTSDYRPGKQAIAELGIRSPLLESGLTKAEIRLLAREMSLPVCDKPASACLASRIPYHDIITSEKLRMTDQAEQYLHTLGFRQLRCRIHGNIARIEVLPDALPALLPYRNKITETLRKIGFQYVTVDLTGYRTGSLNEVL